MPVPVSGSVPGNSRGSRSSAVQDHVALAEIELCGELMIAAAAAELAGEERLSVARIDEVLRVVEHGRDDSACPPHARC
ncbi:hypothetical protein [Streptomyces armeniacus]|uniref:hypothetical protein n=1 Tax=Streptomyces armeniacus TaxID=83291 RepID=UPI001FE3EB06|nr:hypothetical protein [Streptomyces armeniacus]